MLFEISAINKIISFGSGVKWIRASTTNNNTNQRDYNDYAISQQIITLEVIHHKLELKLNQRKKIFRVFVIVFCFSFHFWVRKYIKLLTAWLIRFEMGFLAFQVFFPIWTSNFDWFFIFILYLTLALLIKIKRLVM